LIFVQNDKGFFSKRFLQISDLVQPFQGWWLSYDVQLLQLRWRLL